MKMFKSAKKNVENSSFQKAISKQLYNKDWPHPTESMNKHLMLTFYECLILPPYKTATSFF